MNNYKESNAWKALNHLWKLSPPDMRKEAEEDFKELAAFIKAGQSPAQITEEIPKYLRALSRPCAEFVLENQPNVYHSVMATLENHNFSDCAELISFYIKKYGNTRPYIKKNKNYFEEVAALCWKRFFQDGVYY